MTNEGLPFSVLLDLAALHALDDADASVRRLSDMQTLYTDRRAVEEILTDRNPIIYEFAGLESKAGEQSLSFGLTRMQPGMIGREYHMTKGHFHLNAGDEIYLTSGGSGILLLQSRDGDYREVAMEVGSLAYVPTGWGHRTVNVGEGELSFLSVWPAQIDHDYETVARTGFPRLVLASKAGPEIVVNPTFPRG